jgi:hypothetical protein
MGWDTVDDQSLFYLIQSHPLGPGGLGGLRETKRLGRVNSILVSDY